jgi:hypothetical protein
MRLARAALISWLVLLRRSGPRVLGLVGQLVRVWVTEVEMDRISAGIAVPIRRSPG